MWHHFDGVTPGAKTPDVKPVLYPALVNVGKADAPQARTLSQVLRPSTKRSTGTDAPSALT
jgi:hypothetical protein